MGNLPQSGGTTQSFSNTPQAKDDWFSFTEAALLANSQLYNQVTDTLTLDVMSNDLGGGGKSLFSIDDGYGNQINDLSTTDLLTNSTFSNWQTTANGNWIRIYNGKIEYRLSDGQGGTRDITSLSAGEVLADSFTYAIKMGNNGTLSWATVHITLTGSNDGATITGTATGNVLEAGGLANSDPGTPNASGTLAVTDPDAGEAGFQTPAPATLQGTYGTFTFDTATGQWTYALDNTLTATQALNQGQNVSDSLMVTSIDGTASQAIVVQITGSNDVAAITGTATGAVIEAGHLAHPEGGAPSGFTPGVPTASGTLTVSDVDAGQVVFQGTDIPHPRSLRSSGSSSNRTCLRAKRWIRSAYRVPPSTAGMINIRPAVPKRWRTGRLGRAGSGTASPMISEVRSFNWRWRRQSCHRASWRCGSPTPRTTSCRKPRFTACSRPMI